jgi:hypothetical protein
MESKQCNKCNITKAISNFNKRSRETDGYNKLCKICYKEARKPKTNTSINISEKQCNTCNIIKPSSRSTIKSQANELICDNINGRVGLGTQTPSYQLHLSSDSAAKPSTSTWTVSSDERLKENIQDADLDLCYNNIKNLRLVKYKWKDDVYTSSQVSDRSKLGWIAQEVETVFPKAVEKHNMHGYEDCRTLNNDQIIASMYGCLKKLINIYDNQTNELNILDTNLSKLQNMVDELNK